MWALSSSPSALETIMAPELATYSVVILTSTGGVISRASGSDLIDAVCRAIGRRADFPDANEVRVVSSTGVIASF